MRVLLIYRRMHLADNKLIKPSLKLFVAKWTKLDHYNRMPRKFYENSHLEVPPLHRFAAQ